MPRSAVVKPAQATGNIKRFFVKLSDISLKSEESTFNTYSANVICVIGSGDDKRLTSILQLSKQPTVPKGQALTAVSNEGFLLYQCK